MSTPTLSPVHRMAILAVLAIAILTGGATSALAAGSTDLWYAISITLHDLEADKEPTVVISALAREGTELPVELALAIPKDVTISWAGEVLGGDPNNDPALEYTIESGDEYDTISFTLERSLLAQVEMTAPEGTLTRTDFTAEIDLAWTSAGLADRARIGVAAPMGTHMEDVVPEPTVEVRSVDVLYSVETSPVVEGATLRITGTVAPGMAPEVEVPEAEPDLDEMADDEIEPISAQPDGPVEESTPINTTWVIIGVLAAIVAVLLIFIIGRVRGAKD